MNRIKIILLLLLSINTVFAQELISYDETIEKAEEFLEASNYNEANQYYKKAFKIVNENVITPDIRFDAAIAFSLSNDKKSTYKQLLKISKKGIFDTYTNYKNIAEEEGFKNLHDEKKWSKLLEKIKISEDLANNAINENLVLLLKEISKKDQEVRQEFAATMQKYGDQSDEFKKYGIKVREVDSVNFIEFEHVINKYGWLGPEVIGEDGVNTLFTIVQHNYLEIQKKYLPFIKKAVDDGKQYPNDLAYLEDRIAINSNKMQTYGTQLKIDENKKYYVWPIKNPKSINKRRLKIGLDTLEAYIDKYGIIWNATKHEEDTLKIFHGSKQ